MRKILNNQKGIALMMVMTAIVILMALWGEFTFESKISRIKTTNSLDKSQAKMMAETGLELAMARIKFYREAFNQWNKSEQTRSAIPLQLINQLWETPFIYPVPISEKTSAQVKAVIQEFEKESILDGQFQVIIKNISNKINLNLLRINLFDELVNTPQNQSTQATTTSSSSSFSDDPDATSQKDPSFGIEQQLLQFLEKRVQEKRETDEFFDDRYSNLNPAQLVANLKYYISDKDYPVDPRSIIDNLLANARDSFEEVNISPKYAPFYSFNELYSIPGWSDELIELIERDFGVFPTVNIDLNKINANMFQLLIPFANEDDVKEFFTYRDSPEDPHFFNKLDDFKSYVVNIANLISSNDFDERFSKFKAQGIEFGVSPSLFEVVSVGTYLSGKQTIRAVVSMPVKDTSTGTTQNTQNTTSAQSTQESADENTEQQTGQTTSTNSNNNNENTQELLEPRIVDIQII